jgi:hypothetical protein
MGRAFEGGGTVLLAMNRIPTTDEPTEPMEWPGGRSGVGFRLSGFGKDGYAVFF